MFFNCFNISLRPQQTFLARLTDWKNICRMEPHLHAQKNRHPPPNFGTVPNYLSTTVPVYTNKIVEFLSNEHGTYFCIGTPYICLSINSPGKWREIMLHSVAVYRLLIRNRCLEQQIGHQSTLPQTSESQKLSASYPIL